MNEITWDLLYNSKAVWFMLGAITYYCAREIAERYYKWYKKKNPGGIV